MTIELYNSTLREGAQHTNVNFGLEEMQEIADALLDSANADYIEIHCYPGKTTQYAKNMLTENESIITHHRSCEDDIRNRAKICSGYTAMFHSTSPGGLESLGITVEELKEKIKSDIELARDLGLDVAKYTFENATDTDLELLKELSIIAKDAGAERIGIPDTRGIAGPQEYGQLIKGLVDADITVSTHCHDDLGLAVANSLAAYDAGAQSIDSAILGLGERSGQARTEVINTVLRVKRDEAIPTEELNMITELVSGLTGVYPGPHDPISGEYAFTHRAGTHAHKISKAKNGKHPYLAFSPEEVGRREDFNLSNLSGNSTIETMLHKYGIEDAEKHQIKELTTCVRNIAEETGSDVISREFEYMASKIFNKPLDWFIRRRTQREKTTYRIFAEIKDSKEVTETIQSIKREVRPARYVEEIIGKYGILTVIPNITTELGNSYIDIIGEMSNVKKTETYISSRRWK